MTEDFTIPETHIETMDRLRFEAEQQRELVQIEANRDIKVAKENRKAQRTMAWISTGIAFAVALVLTAGIWAIWIDDDPQTPEDYKTSEAGREANCVERGGGWVPADLLDRSDHGLCVFPGNSVEVPE